MYILKPPAAGFYTPPPLLYAPTPRRVFSRVGGVIKFGPVLLETEGSYRPRKKTYLIQKREKETLCELSAKRLLSLLNFAERGKDSC